MLYLQLGSLKLTHQSALAQVELVSTVCEHNSIHDDLLFCFYSEHL